MKGLLVGIGIIVLLAISGLLLDQFRVPSPAVSSNMLAYTSLAGGISFSYPDIYRVTERGDGYQGNPIVVITLIDKNVVIPDMSDGPPAISILVVSNASSTPLESWVKENSISNFNLSPDNALSPSTMGGEAAVAYSYGGLFDSHAVAALHGGRVYIVNVGANGASDPINADFQKILKTVHFN